MTTTRNYFFLLPVFVLLIVGALFFSRGKNAIFAGFDNYLGSSSPSKNVGSDSIGVPRSMDSRSIEEDGINVEITPNKVSKDGADFTVTVTTHSGSLDFDLAKVSTLSSDSGETVVPISWSGGTGGHHLYGTLKFPGFKKSFSSLKLKLNKISNSTSTKDKVFSWDL